MIKLDKQRRLKIPIDLLELSNINKSACSLYILLKGSDIFLSKDTEICFDGILAKVSLDDKWRFVMPKRIINLLKLNEKQEVLLYVNTDSYIGIKAVN